jgi:hypothetical protein
MSPCSRRPGFSSEDADLFQGPQVLRHLRHRHRAVDRGERVPDLPYRALPVHEVQRLIGVIAAPEAIAPEQGRRRDLLLSDLILEVVVAKATHRPLGLGRAVVDHPGGR